MLFSLTPTVTNSVSLDLCSRFPSNSSSKRPAIPRGAGRAYGVYAETVEGTPQGAGISPLLANIFLHYALDLWVRQWMRRAATGPMRLVRYADDCAPRRREEEVLM